MTFRFVPHSLKYRLLLAFLVGMVLIEAGASYFGYRLMARHTWEEFDRMLADKVRFYQATFYFDDKGHLLSRMGEADWDRLMDESDPDYFHIRFATSRKVSLLLKGDAPRTPDLLMHSRTLRGKDLPRVGEEVMGYTDTLLPQGKMGRAAGALVTTKHFLTPEALKHFQTTGKATGFDPAQIHIVVARSTDSAERSLAEVRWRLFAASLAGTLALLGAGYYIIGRNLRHHSALRQQMDHLELMDPQQRFKLPRAPLELEKVVVRLNALMDRVTVAIENERQFTSNAAHELRTPLAGMRSAIDLALTRTRSAEEYEDTLYRLRDMQWKLQQLTENLLLLTRLDTGQNEIYLEESTLRQFLRTAWKPFFDKACDKEMVVAWKLSEASARLLLPTKLLEIVLRNLFQNAVEYAPAHGRIEITAAVTDGQCTLQITNPNPGLQPSQMERLFQRFWRSDQSGDPNLTSVGIGLSLCQRILTVLGGSITASLTDEQQIALRCVFPVRVLADP